MERKPKKVSLDEIMTTLAWFGGDLLKGLTGPGGLRLLLGLFRRCLANRIKLPGAEDIQGRVLFFQSLMRRDYDEFLDNIAASLPEQSCVLRIDLTDARFFRPNCIEAVPVAQRLSRFASLSKRAWGGRGLWADCRRRQGWLIASWLFFHYIWFSQDLLSLIQVRPKSVVVFAEMQPLDRILSMLCREAGIPCATLQHGLYVEYTETETVNRYNYQPLFVSDFLAWGPYMAKLVARYAPQVRTTVCGKPTLEELKKPQSDPVYDVILIFDQNIFKTQNQQMVDLIRQAYAGQDKKMGIRFHPANIPRDYDLHSFEVVEGDDWLKTRCCVGHTTSFLIDILQSGVPVYRFRTSVESALQDERIEFSNIEELRKLMTSAVPDFEAVLKEFILQRGTAAIEAHRKAILAL